MPTIALLRDVFPTPDCEPALTARLSQAAQLGADLVCLPEVPSLPWAPCSKTPDPTHAEPIGGPRCTMQANAARAAGIALVGGGICTDDAGTRFNTALCFDASGELQMTYRKVHIPDEEGFWEADHYEAGQDPPMPCVLAGMRVGVQICSDNNRPFGCQHLAAHGCEVILNPRATEAGTLDTWTTTWRANALTTGCWILSVNRPHPEGGTPIGGPSVAVSPRGEITLNSEDALTLVEIDLDAVAGARNDYPGYLARPTDIYAKAWAATPPQRAWPDA
ncbi:MAG: carbon-nitrogen hydrolase family protein [Phycisphaerales bacterium]|nr:carbon-nitrogen hydrolase family protein [Phycisphaerales bacterium]